jgi:type I restriction enzyme R subunit
MTTLGSERGAVQNPFIRYAREVGWTYLPPEEARRLRRGETGLLLHDVFVAQVIALNRGTVDPERAEDLAGRLARIPPNIEGNFQAWEYLRGLKTVFIPEERRERNVRLLDPLHPEANSFHVTDELTVQSGSRRIRLDVALFVNGIPILAVETKSAHRLDGMTIALDQMRRYHQDAPEFFALAQLYALTQLVQLLLRRHLEPLPARTSSTGGRRRRAILRPWSRPSSRPSGCCGSSRNTSSSCAGTTS